MFPARAGMSRSTGAASSMSSHVPRASGDEPELGYVTEDGLKCSPRERG